jgi:CTP synthase
VIPAPNVDSIYKIPLVYHQNGLDTQILRQFALEETGADLSVWQRIADKIDHPKKTVKIALVGKYTNHKDSYKSLVEALGHGGIANGVSTQIVWINSRAIVSPGELAEKLREVDGLVVPGGFGSDGIEGKILAIEYARRNNLPFLGICLGMQLAVIEFARNVLHREDANSTEFSRETTNPVIALITEWERDGRRETRTVDSDLGGTMRLGSYDSILAEGSLMSRIYGSNTLRERHRHRYEVNALYVEEFEKNGLIFSGVSKEGGLMECVEIPEHRFFVGTQFHPELTSRPFAVGPLFRELLRSCL